jgi:hypothetical protein
MPRLASVLIYSYSTDTKPYEKPIDLDAENQNT